MQKRKLSWLRLQRVEGCGESRFYAAWSFFRRRFHSHWMFCRIPSICWEVR